ncbi:hypothetical protein BD779DRAFT_1789120 [Infundibulicybe gibba]|nr:hypothetical protein BD779DRAFT_1789120 [Infundibulicybe gibba]
MSGQLNGPRPPHVRHPCLTTTNLNITMHFHDMTVEISPHAMAHGPYTHVPFEIGFSSIACLSIRDPPPNSSFKLKSASNFHLTKLASRANPARVNERQDLWRRCLIITSITDAIDAEIDADRSFTFTQILGRHSQDMSPHLQPAGDPCTPKIVIQCGCAPPAPEVPPNMNEKSSQAGAGRRDVHQPNFLSNATPPTTPSTPTLPGTSTTAY